MFDFYNLYHYCKWRRDENSLELKNILIHRISEINDKSILKAIKTILDIKSDTREIVYISAAIYLCIPVNLVAIDLYSKKLISFKTRFKANRKKNIKIAQLYDYISKYILRKYRSVYKGMNAFQNSYFFKISLSTNLLPSVNPL